MSKFGWSYPAGAANDPLAPYNAPDYDIVMLKERAYKARKEHVCDMCQKPISIGTTYRYFAFLDFGGSKPKLSTSHQHIVCPYEEEWR